MLDPQFPPLWCEMWSCLGRDLWAKLMFHLRKYPHHVHPMVCAVLTCRREADVLHPSSKIHPQHSMWLTGWKPGGCSRRTICELEHQHFPFPRASWKGRKLMIFLKYIYFSPAFCNNCSFSWQRQGLSPKPCPARGQIYFLPGHAVFQQ